MKDDTWDCLAKQRLLITMDSVELYADERKFDENILKHFEECQVHLHPYNAIYEDVETLPEGASILLEPQ